MMNIMVVNCDNVFVEYEWKNKEMFLLEMESDSEDIPMLDDPVITLDINFTSFSEEECKDLGIYTVSDLLEWCKSEEKKYGTFNN